jgi:hypothetical protein
MSIAQGCVYGRGKSIDGSYILSNHVRSFVYNRITGVLDNPPAPIFSESSAEQRQIGKKPGNRSKITSSINSDCAEGEREKDQPQMKALIYNLRGFGSGGQRT